MPPEKVNSRVPRFTPIGAGHIGKPCMPQVIVARGSWILLPITPMVRNLLVTLEGYDKPLVGQADNGRGARCPASRDGIVWTINQFSGG